MSQGTRIATRQTRLKYWSGVFDDRIKSGLKTEEYCKQNNITRDQYYYWLRKVREAALEESGIQFIEVKEPLPALISDSRDPASETRATLTIRICGAEIEVNESTSRKLLEQTLQVLKNA